MKYLKIGFLVALLLSGQTIDCQSNEEEDPTSKPGSGLQPIVVVVIIVLGLLLFFALFLVYWFCIKKKAPKDEVSVESIEGSPKAPKTSKSAKSTDSSLYTFNKSPQKMEPQIAGQTPPPAQSPQTGQTPQTASPKGPG